MHISDGLTSNLVYGSQNFLEKLDLFTLVLSFFPSDDSLALGSTKRPYQIVGLPC